jgi:hypothetical protein
MENVSRFAAFVSRADRLLSTGRGGQHQLAQGACAFGR